jgi:hypothetical protein
MAKAGAMLERQEQAFRNLATAAGTSSTRVIASLKAVSGGMVAEADLMAAAGKAMLMSIPADKITELMKIAAATSRMTGQTITDAFNDITMGVARQSKMILDNLGIIVNVDKANQDYARALGRTADSLTDTERRQAFMNATLAAGNEMITRLGEQQGALDGVNKMVAAQSNLWAEVNKVVAQMLDKELTSYAKMLNWIDAKLKGMRTSAGDASRSDMEKEIEMLRSLESKGLAQPGSTSAKMAEYNRRYLGANEAELANQAAYKDWQKPDQYASWREREGNWAANTEEQNKRLLEAMAEARRKAEADAKRSMEVNKTFWEGYKKEVEGALEFEKYKLDEQFKAFDKYVHDKVALNQWYQAERRKIEIKEYAETAGTQFPAEAYGAESARAKAYTANQKAIEANGKAYNDQLAAMKAYDEKMNQENWWKTYVEDTEDATRANEVFTDSMDIMSQSAADAFAEFKAMSIGPDTIYAVVALQQRIITTQEIHDRIDQKITASGQRDGGVVVEKPTA